MIASLLTAGSALAASDLDFYEGLLNRGIIHFAEGNYAAATGELRIAAFGLGDVLDDYETAHVYLAIAATRLKDATAARASVMRLLSAQRIQSRYTSLPIPAALRQEFDRIAAGVLTREQLADLQRPYTSAVVPPRVSPIAPPPRPLPLPAPLPRSPEVATPAPKAAPKASPMPMPAPQPPPKSSPSSPATSIKPSPQPVRPSETQAPAVIPQPRTEPLAATPRVVVPFPAPQPSPQPVRPVERPRVQPSPAVRPPTPPVSTAPASSVSSPRAPIDLRTALAEGQRALDDGDLGHARERYQTALEAASLTHDEALRIGEGLYRTHDFAGAIRAFQRAGTFARSEAQSQYANAVSLYEVGRYREAKRALADALPHIEMTPDVARYRAKIEASLN